MLINLTLRQLQAFVAVARNESFTKASRAVGISQPALTANVRLIEGTLGVRLFDRTTRSVRLTEQGRNFVAVAERVIADLGAAIASARELGERHRGRVEVACLPSVAVQLVGPLMRAFGERYPGVTIKLYDGDAESVARRVHMKEADFGVSSYHEGEFDLAFVPLVRDRFCVVCRDDHPLARKSSVKLKELEAYPFIAMGTDAGTRRIVDRAAIKADVSLNVVCEIKQLSTLSGMVAAGIGVSILPEACMPNLGQSRLVACKLAAPGIERDLGLVLRRGQALSPGAESFRDLILANIAARWKSFTTRHFLARKPLGRG